MGSADLFLDTQPYNAGTTASDALWLGLPVLTCLGQTFAGRMAASLLRAVGLPELIARTEAEYEELAVGLAADRQRWSALKHKLAANRRGSRLFDTERLTRELERAYALALERWRQGLPAADLHLGSPAAGSPAAGSADQVEGAV